MPKINLNILDKELCLAEFLNLNSSIVVNKTDLDKEKSEEIFKIYTNSGYNVIKTNAEKGEGIESLRKILKNNVSAFARTIWSSVNLLLQIRY